MWNKEHYIVLLFLLLLQPWYIDGSNNVSSKMYKKIMLPGGSWAKWIYKASPFTDNRAITCAAQCLAESSLCNLCVLDQDKNTCWLGKAGQNNSLVTTGNDIEGMVDFGKGH